VLSSPEKRDRKERKVSKGEEVERKETKREDASRTTHHRVKLMLGVLSSGRRNVRIVDGSWKRSKVR